MPVKATKTERVQIHIQEIAFRTARFNLLGSTAMIMNRFSQKARQELLFPSEQKNKAALEQTLKHNPLAEYRGSCYRNRDAGRKTLFHIPSGAIKGAIAQTAIDLPGAARAQIERLTRVLSVQVDLYGVPQIFSAMVRNSGISRTPDVRTRAIFPEWACQIEVSYVSAIITEKSIASLVGAAGLIVGIGDWRGEKGGDFGAFRVVADNDADFRRIVKTQGRAAQQIAFDKPAYYDADTEELLVWFEREVKRREMEGELDDIDAFGLEKAGGRAEQIAIKAARRKAAKTDGNGRRAPRAPVRDEESGHVIA